MALITSGCVPFRSRSIDEAGEVVLGAGRVRFASARAKKPVKLGRSVTATRTIRRN